MRLEQLLEAGHEAAAKEDIDLAQYPKSSRMIVLLYWYITQDGRTHSQQLLEKWLAPITSDGEKRIDHVLEAIEMDLADKRWASRQDGCSEN